MYLASLAVALLLGQADPPPAPPPAGDPVVHPPPAPAAPDPVARPPAAEDAPSATPASTSTAPSAANPTAASNAAAPVRTTPRPAPEPERAQVARTALAFLDALLARDAAALAAASGERFSFDGEVRAGRAEILGRWRALLAPRGEDPRPVLLDLELLPAADAVARLGAPPARIAPLAARGAWVGIANVSGRPVVIFLSRAGARWAVTGIQG